MARNEQIEGVSPPSEWLEDQLEEVAEVGAENLRVLRGHGLLGLPFHHVRYGSGLSDEEIGRLTLDAGDILELWRLEAALKGGGTDGNVSLEVRDVTNSSTLGSVTAGSRVQGDSSPIGTSGSGATVVVRLSTGSVEVDLCTTGLSAVIAE